MRLAKLANIHLFTELRERVFVKCTSSRCNSFVCSKICCELDLSCAKPAGIRLSVVFLPPTVSVGRATQMHHHHGSQLLNPSSNVLTSYYRSNETARHSHTMSRRKLAVCVSTSKPSSSLSSGGGGSIVMLCPQTGTVLSSLRASGDNSSKSLLGISSLSLFPQHYTTLGPPLMIGYGGTTTKRDDTYAMLLSLRPASSPPLIHWKSRLPEAQLSAGLLVSPCGNYIVGGGTSGNLFVWNALGGTLYRSVKAHYRSVTTMAWSDCGSFLVTGGADGMIHVFSLLNLVEKDTGVTVTPIRTWSVHHLPVTALVAMPSGRMIASSEDGQVVMMELFSEKILFTIQMPHAIRTLAHCSGRLFAGAVQGSIYMIDLDEYAIHQTAQLGVTVKHVSRVRTHEDEVFSADRSEAYKTELLGHEKKITSLAVFEDDDCEWLVSGDDAGEVRMWDLQSRGCVRVIRPWSLSVAAAAKRTSTSGKPQAKQALHPITSILIVPRDEATENSEIAFGGDASKEGKGKTGIVSLVSPLQRYPDRVGDAEEDKGAWIPVPFLQPKRARSEVADQSTLSLLETLKSSTKRPRVETSEGTANQESKNNDVERLQRELEEAKSTIKRWEQVNNTLMAKLNQTES